MVWVVCLCVFRNVQEADLDSNIMMGSRSGWHQLSEGNYMMKKTYDDHKFKIIISDMIHVWVNESSPDELLSVFQEFNPLIECSDHTIVDKLWNLLDDDDLQSSMNTSSRSLDVAVIDDTTIDLKFKAVMDGLAVKFHLRLQKGTSRMFFEEVTLSLLSAAEELLSRQESLCSHLLKKDTEIAQYKLEGASLSRRNVETKVFSKEDFLKQSHMERSSSSPCVGVMKVLQGASFSFDANIKCKDTVVIDTVEPHQQVDESLIVDKVNNSEHANWEVVKSDSSTSQATIEHPSREAQTKVVRKKKIKLNL